MEREADLPPPRPIQRRELGPISEDEQPQKIGDFLRHARAVLRRPQPSAMSTSSLGRARRVLVTQTGSSQVASLNSCVGSSTNISETEAKVMKESPLDTNLFMADNSRGNVISRTDQADQLSAVQQENVDCKRRKGDLEVSPDDARANSVSHVKNVGGENVSMGTVGVRQELMHICGLVPSESVAQECRSVNSYTSLNKDFKVHESLGDAEMETFRISSQRDQPYKAMVTDGSEKVGFSSSGYTDGEVCAVKASKGNAQSADSHVISCEKQQPLLSNNFLMPITEDRFEPMDTAASACPTFSQRADKRMATGSGMENLSSYFGSLAFTEKEGILTKQVEQYALNNQGMKQEYPHVDMIRNDVAPEDIYMGGSGSMPKRNVGTSDQKFMAFIGKETTNPLTVSSGVATATSLQCTSAAPLNSGTYNRSVSKDVNQKVERDLRGEPDAHLKATSKQTQARYNQSDSNAPSAPSLRPVSDPPATGAAISIQMSLSSVSQTSSVIQDQGPLQGGKHLKQEIIQSTNVSVDCVKISKPDQELVRGKDVLGPHMKNEMRPQPKETRMSSSNINPEPSGGGNTGKIASSKESISRKKQYDPDVFFKVNGKLYQKLGKIGSGGSSEVYKVISSDCTIYALKKIKLKGRDYCTAYGFCQEIEYLNRLRGKNNIIQLVDYEVTDKRLLEEANSDLINTKDGRINDDACIYMVLEHGEIDLAHMLSQKWREMDSSNTQIDENWLRFYWQQILKAVNTIHEERIVHSDLKPANFLLVRGSLKLIDFGIAKAIQSDTTNIQRDSQVGTLNYMSPEAFMCNDQDSDGNTIKCGRPSDIWSLGCILYQMVYGRTPFAEYKTFWAKFKVITDRNHEISYGAVSNPWLVDLMKKCLAWDRNERWRIPQLLDHPFLAPPVPSQVPSTPEQHCKLLVQIAERYSSVPQVSLLCSQLKQLIIRLSIGTKSSAEV